MRPSWNGSLPCTTRSACWSSSTSSCVREPRVQLARTYAFLGLEPFEPSDQEIARPRNESRGSPVAISPMSTGEVLRRLYRPEVRRLRELVPDLDLSLWPDYADLA